MAALNIVNKACDPDEIMQAWTADVAPDNVLALERRGTEVFHQKNYLHALYYFRRAAKMKTDDQCALAFWGACLYRLGRRADARGKFETALDVAPQGTYVSQIKKWLKQCP